jgi:hypothetical protein
MDVDLVVKYFFCANYTVKSTTARWMARLSDDTIVNFAKLGQFIGKLEVEYDPLREFVFKGHCVDPGDFWNHSIFPQGGAGFVLSRFACETALAHRTAIFRQMTLQEDLIIGRYLIENHFSPEAMSCSSFIGHSPKSDQLHLLEMGEKRYFPTCGLLIFKEEIVLGDGCGSFLTPLNDVVFVHAIPHPGWKSLLRLAYRYFEAPSWVMWWNGMWGIPKFCKGRKEDDWDG